MLSRREFLQRSSLLALAPSVPTFLVKTARAAEPKREARVLVVLQLGGGNDGINTVVPFADEGYARARKSLRLADDKILKITDTVGLHPSMRDAAKLLESGRLAIVQGVGYPNPSRSHEVSMAIWQTARFDREEHKGYGWIGRALDTKAQSADTAPAALLVGNESLPVALQGRRALASALADLNDFTPADPLSPVATAKTAAANSGRRDAYPTSSDDVAAFVRRSALDAYATADRLKSISQTVAGPEKYPGTELARRFSLVSRLIKAGFETPVYYVMQSGYDTHAAQLFNHANLLRELSEALRTFLDDLQAAGLSDRVAVLAFSEFGRRVEENGSQGTDHGTAGPVLLAGSCVQSGLVGTTPSLSDLDSGDLKMSLDFRRVYATVLDEWLSISSEAVLGQTFEKLALFKS